MLYFNYSSLPEISFQSTGSQAGQHAGTVGQHAGMLGQRAGIVGQHPGTAGLHAGMVGQHETAYTISIANAELEPNPSS